MLALSEKATILTAHLCNYSKGMLKYYEIYCVF